MLNFKLLKLVVLFLIVCTTSSVYAKIWLPSILSDNMVIQQQSEVVIWGWTTNAAEEITVKFSWATESVKTKAYQGNWAVTLKTPKAGGPYTVTISGHEIVTLKNVLIGEVWLCSGQSNMEWTPSIGLVNAEEEIKNANYEQLRFFQVHKKQSKTPQDNFLGSWESCTPNSVKDFSSVAYFYGRKLHKELSIPIGLIHASWGGTPVETWIQRDLISGNNRLKEAAQQLKEYAWWPIASGAAYNAMIHPLTKFNIAGVIWYQGESNRDIALSYYESFPLLINSWREAWKKTFPFYFVQIAPYKYDVEIDNDAAIVRDAQLQTMLHDATTGMAVTNDIGNLEDIHPKNKQEVGRRLALWALAKTYGVKDIVFSGPIYESMRIEKNKIRLHFKYTANGLVQKGKELKEFYIAGEDQKFYKAKAKIKNNTVVVWSSKVKNPVAVRFAFTNTALPNLYNSAGLPASAFRTDNWNIKLR